MILLDYRFDVLVGARHLNKFVAFFVDQKFALYTLKALASQTPNSVMTEGTKCSLPKKKLNLVSVPIIKSVEHQVILSKKVIGILFLEITKVYLYQSWLFYLSNFKAGARMNC